MRIVGTATAAVAALGVALGVMAPAQAAGGWTMEERSAWFQVTVHQHQALQGHEGNWHSVSLDYDGDDDGLTGGILDWQCPDDATTLDPDVCEVVGDFELWEAPEVVVTYTDKARFAHLVGPAMLEDQATGEMVDVWINLRVRATGELSRTATTSVEGGTRYRVVETSGADIVARGHLGNAWFGRPEGALTRDLVVRRVWSKPVA